MEIAALMTTVNIDIVFNECPQRKACEHVYDIQDVPSTSQFLEVNGDNMISYSGPGYRDNLMGNRVLVDMVADTSSQHDCDPRNYEAS